ncbi:MAG: orotidine-5'-phosphate decarboxylase [Alphaproteobacteria bacterium]|nr:orotidine-5'-phosphate decarboxylase [Alphaproteobacteria bacterium]
MHNKNPVFCALDVNDTAKAVELVSCLKQDIGGIKIGLEFFLSNNREGYEALAKFGLPIFLDLKLHDIPNTVYGAVKALMTLKPAFLTIHASGGADMIQAAVNAVKETGAGTKILAVTVLTSLEKASLDAVGQGVDVGSQVLRLARLAKDNGAGGCVCSPEEVQLLRKELGNDFVLMVPGIRPAWAASNDQKRTLTPLEAHKAGASFLVIGRPITKASNPLEAARKISLELGFIS